jgi:hypothetical protein
MFVRPAAMIVAIAASLSLTAPPAGATVAHRTFRAHWPLNEASGKKVVDRSGHHNNGRSFHVAKDGSGYTFNGKDSRVVVPTAKSLNPKNADFSFRVKLSMTKPPTPVGETYDVLRKGLVTTAGGDYKFEVKNVKGMALGRCVVRSVRKNGTTVLASVEGTTDLADGDPHKVTCNKSSKGITIRVDSLAPQSKTYPGGLGRVANKSNLALGAKAESTATTGFDWFDGVILNAWVATP